MWELESIGLAKWHSDGEMWTVRGSGGTAGIGIAIGDATEPLLKLEPVDSDPLPDLAEQFVRGDELHLDYPQVGGPQTDGIYGVKLVCRPVEFGTSRVVWELVIAVETSLLESHPTLDLTVPGVGLRRRMLRSETAMGAACGLVETPSPQQLESLPAAVGSRVAAPITQVNSGSNVVSVLLGSRDFPWTLDLSDDRHLRLRLFGEFLEKGVILKARAWIVVEARSEPTAAGPFVTTDAMVATDPTVAEGLSETWRKLCQTPLPLTA